MVKKLLAAKAKERPTSGVVMAKGKPNEMRLKYKDMLRVIASLEQKLSEEGCMSFGICKTCNSFNPRVSSSGFWGQCGGKLKHEYDSCENHSKTGGGFGL